MRWLIEDESYEDISDLSTTFLIGWRAYLTTFLIG